MDIKDHYSIMFFHFSFWYGLVTFRICYFFLFHVKDETQ